MYGKVRRGGNSSVGHLNTSSSSEKKKKKKKKEADRCQDSSPESIITIIAGTRGGKWLSSLHPALHANIIKTQ